MKHRFTAFFLILCSGLFSQVQVLNETFAGLANGTTASPTGLWSSTCIGCTSDASSFFDVRTNTFMGQNTDAEGIWITKWFNVSAYQKVNIYLNILGDAQNDVGDYCFAEYSVNNGAFTALTTGSHNPLLATTVFAYAQISNADSVRVRVRVLVNATNEGYTFDNVEIVAVEAQPGSGYRLDFDDAGAAATGDYVEIPSLTNLVGGSFTVTAWINPDNVSTAGQRIFCDDETNAADGYAFSLGDPGAGRLRFYIRSANPVSLDMSNATYYLTNGSWYHVAMVHDAASNVRQIYVNGVLAANDTYTNNPGATPDAVAAIGGETTASAEATNRFDGKIDEVTIWTTNLSQTQIRDLMCKKTSTPTANLIAYYKFDEGLGYLTRDEVGTFPGRLINFDLPGDWDVSGAPIGNTSIYNYTGAWGGVTVYLASADQDSFSISSVAGTPEGMHIYNVSEAPNHTTGASGVGANDQYYGVFKAFGTAPTYTATYYYRHNDAYQLGTASESDMILCRRTDNSSASWTNPGATLNTVNKRLTLTAQSTEFLLGNSTTSLPITLLYFDALAEETSVLLNWETLSEINNDYFTLEKSIDLSSYENIARIPGSGNSRIRRQYSYVDRYPYPGTSYYRLKQTDFNGDYSLSEPRSVSLNMPDGIFVYPNPAKDYIDIVCGNCDISPEEIILYDGIGRVQSLDFLMQEASKVKIDIRGLNSGTYYLLLRDHPESSHRMIISH